MEQYNLGRVRRGETIDHPIPIAPGSNDNEFQAILDHPDNAIGTQEEVIEPADFDPELFDIASSQSSTSTNMSQADSSGHAPMDTGSSSRASKRRGNSVSGASTSKSGKHVQPGTGGNTDGGGESGGSEMAPSITIPPIIANHTGQRVFSKTHVFASYGVANVIIASVVGATTQQYYTTGLLQIPVNQPCLYMTRSEWSLILPGEKCTKVNVCVKQRNVRVAFQTAASTSDTATLNQNKDCQFAIGLNKLGWGGDVKYTYDGTETMKPVSVSSPNTAATIGGYMYGADTVSSTTPAIVTQEQFHTNNYFCMAKTRLTADATFQYGWPILSTKTRTYNAADAVDQCVVEYTYEPAVGVLKDQPAYVTPGVITSDETIEVPSGDMVASFATVEVANKRVTAETQLNDPVITSVQYTNDIEKSRWLRQGLWHNPGVKEQPSLHVGVKPVAKMGAATTGLATSWLDTEALWEVTATMWTEYNMSSEYTHSDPSYTVPQHRYYRKGTTGPGLFTGNYRLGKPTTATFPVA